MQNERRACHTKAVKRAVLAAVIVLGACSGSGGNAGAPPIIAPSSSPTAAPPLLANVQRISADPFTNSSSQHATQLEPSAASSGQTIVAAFQTGRFFTFGSSDIGFATSLNAGLSWQTGTLPAITHYTLPAGPFDSVSDPAVAYDAAHATWLIASLPILFSGNDVPGDLVSRSQDGLTWSAPVDVTASNETTNDKSWITCDDHPASPFYGHCYVEWDSFEGNGLIFMSVSSDGGKTWGPPASPGTSAGGLGGQPVVQPSGTVIVPIDDLNEQNVLAFNSRNGGTTWTTPVLVSAIADHQDAANLRSFPLISAAIDAAGTVYTVWQDCRFRAGCASNDLVMSTSSDGTTWSPPARIPIDAVSSSVDHFLPGIGVEDSTSGNSAQLGLTYYSYANTSCTAAELSALRELHCLVRRRRDVGRAAAARRSDERRLDCANTRRRDGGRLYGEHVCIRTSGRARRARRSLDGRCLRRSHVCPQERHHHVKIRCTPKFQGRTAGAGIPLRSSAQARPSVTAVRSPVCGLADLRCRLVQIGKQLGRDNRKRRGPI